jgi:2-methylcitrate dehydratase PrpD
MFASSLGEFVAGLNWESVPPQIQDRTRDRLLDAISTAVGSRDVDTTLSSLRAMVANAGEVSTVLPLNATTTPEQAAFINGVATHAILFEDINLASADHPGAVVVPAALAIAEAAERVTGKRPLVSDLLAGILAGYEVQVYLGELVAPEVIARGFRTTSVFGSVAAAAAAAKVLDLSAEQTRVAVSIGASFSHGFTEPWAHGTMEPYFQAGAAARNGVLATLLASGGASGAPLAFEGPTGMLKAFAGVVPSTYPRIDERWRITDVLCKPYPISGAKLAVVDSALAAMDGTEPGAKISRVTAWVPELTKEYPGGDRTAPFATLAQAQDSTQFCIATAVLGRSMTSLKTFTDGFQDPEVAELTHRIELIGEPDRALSRVEAIFEDGTTAIGEVDGGENYVPSIASMSRKLEELAEGFWSEQKISAVIEMITSDAETEISALTTALRAQ